MRAAIWNGAAASWEDLSQAAPGQYGDTYAYGAWADAANFYVVGYGVSRATGNSEALLWMRPLPFCYPNCDNATTVPLLNVNDYICFQNRFAAGDPYANCDGSTQTPVLNVNDFICFQTRFAAGCP
jgi:hypothetical protein